MIVNVARNAGYCFGVKRAMECAMQEAHTNAFTLGELIHNEYSVEQLKKNGINTIDRVEDAPLGATIIIRSHGVGKNVYALMESRGHKIIDATCPFVKKIHDIVYRKHANGYNIIIVGHSKHPEVTGINGWCESSAIVVDNIENKISINPQDKLCVVFQTTYSVELKNKFIEIIKKLPNKTVEIFDTICYTTIERQTEALELSRNSTVVLVVGSKKSSNTMKLFDIAKGVCDNTYFVESAESLKKIKFTPQDTVSILAGASTPNELIMEVEGSL